MQNAKKNKDISIVRIEKPPPQANLGVGMFKGASNLIFENATHLRKNMTHAETILWLHLRKGINGLKFRRQHPIGIFIADFYCHKVKLIVEVDGSIHTITEVKENDEVRQQQLTEWGYEIIRFTNKQIINEVEKILELIKEKIETIFQINKRTV